ncbi:MAG: shikimate dehydrogenase [Chitinophagaceae bacterium]|nr:shikimate dehydrogenase [Chitinophagaceae bacterium]
MKKFGLIGYPLGHSFSKSYFEEKFAEQHIEASYDNFPLKELNEIPALIQLNQIQGFNVTIPYKEKIIQYLDEIDEVAKLIGAVNCVQIKEGRLIGYNTDVIGFELSLMKIMQQPIQALVFGTGGSAQAVKFVLRKHQIPFQSVSRNEAKDCITYADLDENVMKQYHLLINTTPVGMYPHIDQVLPLPYQFISKKHIAFDLIYNPPKTKFLTFCEAEGAHIKNGLEMLYYQADESWRIFMNQ